MVDCWNWLYTMAAITEFEVGDEVLQNLRDIALEYPEGRGMAAAAVQVMNSRRQG